MRKRLQVYAVRISIMDTMSILYKIYLCFGIFLPPEKLYHNLFETIKITVNNQAERYITKKGIRDENIN